MARASISISSVNNNSRSHISTTRQMEMLVLKVIGDGDHSWSSNALIAEPSSVFDLSINKNIEFQ